MVALRYAAPMTWRFRSPAIPKKENAVQDDFPNDRPNRAVNGVVFIERITAEVPPGKNADLIEDDQRGDYTQEAAQDKLKRCCRQKAAGHQVTAQGEEAVHGKGTEGPSQENRLRDSNDRVAMRIDHHAREREPHQREIVASHSVIGAGLNDAKAHATPMWGLCHFPKPFRIGGVLYHV
jgi:hypothetical protein